MRSNRMKNTSPPRRRRSAVKRVKPQRGTTAMVSGGPGALVWNFSDIANALMAIPNLICMLLLSGEIAKDVKEFQPEIKK